MDTRLRRRAPVVIVILLAAAILPWLLKGRDSGSRRVVIYCAHDASFADEILRDFEKNTGIVVDVRYDEEASKSLGLTSLLIAEKARPRCDVFWNNQTLGTIRLKENGVLAPCDPAVFAHIPEEYRDPDHCWCGFAVRLRVWIVNTRHMPATMAAVREAMEAPLLNDVAIAVPLFGTTLTHYTVLCRQLGLDGLKAWHASLHERGIREARGNAAVRDLVAAGVCKLGLTDTDDAFAALDAGQPVAILPVQLESGQTICIPNSVALIARCPHPTEAAKLIRFLLSPETELRLARSASRQVPLGPVRDSELPPEVRALMDDVQRGFPLQDAARHDQEVLNWLTAERQ
jgi:iron(III) transport system substrate-binding protein